MSNPLSELLASGEGGYGSYNRGRAGDAGGKTIDFSQMTLGEVQALQHLPRRDPDRLFAVGKYQIIPGTMDMAVNGLKLDPNQKFTPDLQERIFSEYLIVGKQPGIKAYIAGQEGASLHTAQKQLAAEWASVADPDTGLSAYGKVGNNKASISANEAATGLNQMRAEYATSIQQGMTPEQAWKAVTAAGTAQTQDQPSSDKKTQTQATRSATTDALADNVLRQGEKGADVKGLQQNLNTLGIKDANGNRLAEDSNYGKHTKEAVESFQRANGLKVDGIAGPRTLEAIGNKLPEAKVTVERAEVTGVLLVTDARHPNNAVYKAISDQLPAGTKPEVAANVALQAVQNGITSPDKLQSVTVQDGNAYVMGTTQGDLPRWT